MISMIAAMDEQRVIGHQNTMPWHLPAELQYFKTTTMGHTVVMGRKTFESIGRPLPGRRNVVLTRQRDWQAVGVDVIHAVEELAVQEGEELFIIGGAELYRTMMPRADRLYVTRIQASFEGDAFFPEIDPAIWESVSEKPGIVDEKNQYPHTFFVFERREQVQRGNK